MKATGSMAKEVGAGFDKVVRQLQFRQFMPVPNNMQMKAGPIFSNAQKEINKNPGIKRRSFGRRRRSLFPPE